MSALRSRFEMKTLLQSGNAVDDPRDPGQTLLRPQRLPGYLDLLQAPLKLRNLITVGATDNNTVEWVRQTAVASAAAETAEASATSGSSGTKPESGMTFDLQNTVVQTIAHWIPATRAALADMAQLRTIIDSQLLDGVSRRLNSQILKGDGNAPNLAGILSQPIQSQDDVVGVTSGARYIERVLAAITKVRLAFLEPTAILMHPLDFQSVRLSKDEFGQYYFGSPAQVGETTLWGLPVIEDVTVDQGEPIVGDWSQAILYVREDVNILASDSHSDFFVRNMIVILGEARYALAVPRPDAFCTVDFETAENPGPS
jgi:HK97 family phage major capsid protein